MIEFHRLSPLATLPTKNDGDAGYDLYAAEDAVLLPGSRQLISTGISVNLAALQEQRHLWPSRYFTPVGIIKDRSGVSSKTGLHCMAGVIDRDYTGEIKVLMVNLNLTELTDVGSYNQGVFDWMNYNHMHTVRIEKGQKIAQMVVTLAYDGGIQASMVPFKNELRGDNGFGSTGK